MEQLPKIARERLAQQHVDSDHPAADLLTAFVERSLAHDERERVLGHLARCAECRDVVALTASEAEPALRDALPPERAWHEWWLFRFGGLAAALTVILIAVLLFRPHERKGHEASVAAKLEDTGASSSPAGPSTYAVEAGGEHGTQTAMQGQPEKAVKTVQERDKLASKSARRAAAPRSTEQRGRLPGYLEGANSQAANAQTALEPDAGLSGPSAKDVSGAGQSGKQAVIGGPKPLSRTDSAVIVGGIAGKVSRPPSPAPSATSTPVQQDEIVKNQQQQGVAYDRATAASQPTPAPPAAQPANAPSSTSETVEVTAQRTPAVTHAEIARARKGKPAAVGSAGAAAKAPSVAGAPAPVNFSMRWTISAAGTVQRSSDNGEHWQPVLIAEGATFRTLATAGSEVWAGGSALYHSSDVGANWMRVNVADKQEAMEGEITRIELPSETRVEVTTSAGQKWTSEDRGRTWKLH